MFLLSIEKFELKKLENKGFYSSDYGIRINNIWINPLEEQDIGPFLPTETTGA